MRWTLALHGRTLCLHRRALTLHGWSLALHRWPLALHRWALTLHHSMMSVLGLHMTRALLSRSVRRWRALAMRGSVWWRSLHG